VKIAIRGKAAVERHAFRLLARLYAARDASPAVMPTPDAYLASALGISPRRRKRRCLWPEQADPDSRSGVRDRAHRQGVQHQPQGRTISPQHTVCSNEGRKAPRGREVPRGGLGLLLTGRIAGSGDLSAISSSARRKW